MVVEYLCLPGIRRKHGLSVLKIWMVEYLA